MTYIVNLMTFSSGLAFPKILIFLRNLKKMLIIGGHNLFGPCQGFLQRNRL